MTQPSKDDIEKAQAYLRLRLDAEHSMTYNLETVMREAAKRMVQICYAAKINPVGLSYDNLPLAVKIQIDEVIAWLRDVVDDYFLTLAIYDHDENRDEIRPFILGLNHGMTFDQRLDDYCDKYRDEIIMLIGVGLALGIPESALAKSLGENLKKPYNNPLLTQGKKSMTYGKGRTNSMFTAIGGLTRFGIAQAWMKNQYIENLKDGCIGWQVQRGSTYPCDLCDSMAGMHEDEESLPPYHLSCCCIAVPIYVK